MKNHGEFNEESSELVSLSGPPDKVPNSSINKQLQNIAKSFFEKKKDIQKIHQIFEIWISNFLNSRFFIETEEDFKLYDLFETFNQIIIEFLYKKSYKAGIKSEIVEEHIELSSGFLNQLIRQAIQNFSIFNFLDSIEWNDLLLEYQKNGVNDYQCIISLKKLIMLLDLLKIKFLRYKMKKGW